MKTGDTVTVGRIGPEVKAANTGQLDAISWGLFLIWIGIAVLAHVGWGWALLGMSAIILGSQAALWRHAGKVDAFSVACGLVFSVGGARSDMAADPGVAHPAGRRDRLERGVRRTSTIIQ
jgi:hypothetical protein